MFFLMTQLSSERNVLRDCVRDVYVPDDREMPYIKSLRTCTPLT
jgi:hypothetical protein